MPLPEPPATVSVEDVREKGMSDTEMLQAALKWAHEQPVTEGEAARQAGCRWLLVPCAVRLQRARFPRTQPCAVH